MKRSTRTLRFVAVGWLGFAVQIATLACLSTLARWPWLPATAAAVEAAIVHNYIWHARWTWRDRSAPPSLAGACARFLRYNAATGLVSIAGNVVLTGLFLAALPLNAIGANLLAVAALTIANFFVADRWVFPRLAASAAVAASVVAVPGIASAQPSTETLQAWDRYITTVEARIDRERDVVLASTEIAGETIAIEAGTIHRWRGTVFVPGTTVDRLLASLLRGTCPAGNTGAHARAREEAERGAGAPRANEPGCGAEPHLSEDVAESRTLERNGDTVRTYIRLVRHAIVTVEYDTEHEMRFRRWSPALATGRSVATSIREVGGDDHGFLWRLNSYWTYRQAAGGVAVDLESITLSRSIPAVVRPIAMPIVRHIARESMARTLDAFCRRFRS